VLGNAPVTHRRCDIAVYVYRCAEHGTTETRCAMGTATSAVACPSCGAAATRVFTAPRLSFGSPLRRALLDRTEATRDHPDVVSAPPPRQGLGRRADVVRNPALNRLPRP
jgi:putative FmdB family regulatory protein